MAFVSEPFPVFYDDDGTPLEEGMIYVGVVNQDARANPVQLYSDVALTVPISQPVRTLSGRPAYQGSPINIYTGNTEYSLDVQNRFGTPIMTLLNATNPIFSFLGLASRGQVTIATNTTVSQAVHSGKVALATVAGINITFPASGFPDGSLIAVSNVSSGAVNLVFPGGSDAAATLPAGDSLMLSTDGTGYWRALFDNAEKGIQSIGQIVISADTSLTAAAHSGRNLLIGTAGVTITLPSSGFINGAGVTLSNVSSGNITLAYPGGSDGPTTLLPGGSAQFFCDGSGFWRTYFYSAGSSGTAPTTVNGSGQNYFPNSELQIMSAVGPGWDGNPATLNTYLDTFDTRQNWLNTGSVFPNITVTNISTSVAASGQITVTAQGDNAVQFLYPGSLGAFTPASVAASVANPALLQTTFRVLTVNYTNLTFTFYVARNGRYSGGSGPTTGAVNYQFRPVMRGGNNSVGSGNGPDGWIKTAGASIYIDEWPEISNGFGTGQTYVTGASAPNIPGWVSNLRPSMKRALVFVPSGTSDALSHNKTPVQTKPFRGRDVVWGAWVKGQAGKTISLVMASNAVLVQTGPAITATGAWQWVEYTYPVPTNATDLTLSFQFNNSVGVPWTIAQPRMDYGTLLGTGNYVPSTAATLPFITQIVPTTYFGADFTASAGCIIDWFGETGGQVASDVHGVSCVLEGTGAAAGNNMFILSASAAPTRYGAAMFAYNGTNPVATPFQIHLNEGTSWMITTSGHVWADVSIDTNFALMT